jgi:putative transposase
VKVDIPLARLQSGLTVRIHGQQFIVGQMTEAGWNFTSKDGKQQCECTFRQLRHMMQRLQLTSDFAHRTLTHNVQAALAMDWGSFTAVEQMSALRKRPFVEAVDKLPLRHRDKRKHVTPLICEANARATDPFPQLPSFRRVREWYRRWVAAGRDIRALVDFHRKKGNRDPRLQDWEYEEIDAAIAEIYDTELRGSESATYRRARDRILLRGQKDGLTISPMAKEVLGKNAIGRVLARREKYPIIANRFGRAIADQTIRNLGVGPQADYPLSEAEVDHTLLDIIVVHKNGQARLGRPWLTAIIDRYSRLIIGFAISFARPSWLSVMEALWVAVLPKDDFLASLGGGFKFEWDCFGVPDCLYCDNGPEFRSTSMKVTEAVLNMRIIDVAPARPDLKGKIERWFRTLNEDLVHSQPGTTFSNPHKRLQSDSVGNASLTLADVNWIIARWIVDIYNQRRHSGTGDVPAERWKKGMAEFGAKPPPPKELIAPLVGMVVTRKLRREGVRYNKLRWNSNAFQALRNRIGTSVDALIRVDPLDIRHAYILDEETGNWVEGDLLAETEVEKLTLSQYEHLRQKLDSEDVFDDARALKMAQASQDIRDFVDGRKKSAGIVPKAAARFVTEGRKPAEHIHQERWSLEESDRPLGSHDPGAGTPMAPQPDARGPWRETVLPARSVGAEPTWEASRIAGEFEGGTETPAIASPPKTPAPIAFQGRRRKQ